MADQIPAQRVAIRRLSQDEPRKVPESEVRALIRHGITAAVREYQPPERRSGW